MDETLLAKKLLTEKQREKKERAVIRSTRLVSNQGELVSLGRPASCPTASSLPSYQFL